jgi:Na+:H+ antiporter, NhaA family
VTAVRREAAEHQVGKVTPPCARSAMSTLDDRRPLVPPPLSLPTALREYLRNEAAGGVVLMVAAVVALVWANSPWRAAYAALWETPLVIQLGRFGIEADLRHWVDDGLMTLFFLVVGLEIKRELVDGELRTWRRAALPVVAAAGGMAVPALIYAAANAGGPGSPGWGVPMATDIAFALGVLALLGSRVPAALKVFLLTLAVVDDLLAIVIIAVFYTAQLSVVPLLGALVPLAIFAGLVQRRVRSWWLLLPLAAVTWALVHASGVHATVAGVLLAFTVPVVRSQAAGGPEAGPGLAEHFEHRFRPISAGVAVPVFAFFSAGVTVGGLTGLGSALTDSVAVGIIVGLVVGKTVGITAATWLVSRFTRAELDRDLGWPDVLGLSLLGGIGFTVSLLIGELAFGAGTPRDEHVKVGVLAGTLLAALLAAVLLRARDRRCRRIADADADGIPDVYQDRQTRSIAAVGTERPTQHRGVGRP